MYNGLTAHALGNEQKEEEARRRWCLQNLSHSPAAWDVGALKSRLYRPSRHEEYCETRQYEDVHQSDRHGTHRHRREEYPTDEVGRHPLDLAVARREVAVTEPPRRDQG